MRIIRILTFAIIMCLPLMLPKAEAAFLSVSPIGPFDASSASSITYDVYFNVEAGESFTFISWSFDMLYDTSELDNWSASFDLGGTSETSPGSLNNQFFSLSPGTDVTFASTGAHLLSSITFDILNPVQALDGLPDFSVASQIGDLFDGFGTSDFQTLQFEGAAGADVGSPVPVPGAVWLLGSGILGIMGLRRKSRRP